MTTVVMNLADLKCPSDPEGRTYRQINSAKVHAIPIGALVELCAEGSRSDGARAFVVFRGRDCDETPLYYVSLDPDDVHVIREGFRNPGWKGGFSEDSLKVIR